MNKRILHETRHQIFPKNWICHKNLVVVTFIPNWIVAMIK